MTVFFCFFFNADVISRCLNATCMLSVLHSHQGLMFKVTVFRSVKEICTMQIVSNMSKYLCSYEILTK